jgi:hypothetical protein
MLAISGSRTQRARVARLAVETKCFSKPLITGEISKREKQARGLSKTRFFPRGISISFGP